MKKFVILIISILFSFELFAQKFENLALTPPMGWNSWNKYGCEINEEIVKSVADNMVRTGLADLGYKYIIIDDCWQIGRDKQGNILVDPAKFPSGMKALADYIHSKGLKFGLYSSAGNKTCQGRPGSRGHEYQDARTYASWDIDFLKYDFCFHEELNAKEAYKTMRDALYEAKRPIVFNICEWGSTKPWLWGKDVGHLWRTTPDIKDCADCIFETGAIGWLNILERQAELASYAGPGHWNDPDMLEVGNGGMNFYENKSHFTMWCMIAAPLILGHDLSLMSDETLRIISNKQLIAINQDVLGKQARRYLQNDDVEIWIKELTSNRYAVAILNTSKNPTEYKLEWNMRYMTRQYTNWANKDVYNLYNVWEDVNIGKTNKAFEATLAGRDVILLVLSKDK